jgi:predicted MFS family arabinose efflux permease
VVQDAQVLRTRWSVLAAFVVVTSANQMLWLTYAPLTTKAAEHYDVSEGTIGGLSAVFPLRYVVLAIPFGILLDRHLNRSVLAGAVLTAAGAVLRCVGDDFAWVLVGQLVVAVAQPLVTSSVAKVAAHYSTHDDEPTAIAVCSAGLFAGMLLAFGTGAAIGDDFRLLLAVQAAWAVAGALLLTHGMRAPGRAEDLPLVASGKDAVRTVWADQVLRTTILLVVVGFGVFVGLTTWLQALLEPAGVGETEAGVLLLVMVVAGVIGSVVIPPAAAHRHAESQVLLASLVVTAAGCAVMAATQQVVVLGVVLAVMGLLLLSTLPVILEVIERRAGSASGTAAALLWMAGNAGGLVVTGVLAPLLKHPAVAFLVLGVVALLGLPLLRRLAPHALSDTPVEPAPA